jgi:hypothetical protein
MSRKEVIYQGLLDLPVVIEDFSVSSPNYFRVTNLPTEFTSGQNIFKFKGNPDVFVEDTPIEIEILDSNGDPIYFEVDLDLESSEQEAIISVFITQDIPPGAVEIILCGVIDQDANGNRISVTTQPNFRWTTTVATNPSKRNATEIIFNVTPSVTITSSTGSYLDKIYSGGNKFVDVTIDNLDYRYVNNTAVFLTSSATVTPFNPNVVSAKAFISSSAISSATSLSPTIPGTLATAIFTSSLSITSGSGVGYLTDFIALSILNSNSQYIPRQGRISSITVTYEQTASAEPATENKYNLATVFFTNLNPTVGTVARIRSYYRSSGIGEYILSNETDITSTETEFGFTAEVVTASFAIPTVHRNDRLDFKFEFINPSGIVAKQSIQSLNNLFLGGNTYVGGDDNLLTGSLFVAGETGTGVQLSGRNNAALIRSIGYTGFSNALDGTGQAGFVMYSGSVQSLLTAAESYAGVGLELVANSESYFRYATDNGGELDVRTNKFFLGNDQIYISGSNGNVEISSSNFQLTAAGDVIASDGEFRGTNLADLYIYRNSIIDSTNNQLSEFSSSGQNFVSLNLTGSYDPALNTTGPATFIRINPSTKLANFPLGAIVMHPSNSIWSAPGNKYQNFGATIILEAATTFYIAAGIGPHQTPDSDIVSNPGDIFYPMFRTYTIGGNTYNNTMKVTSGTRILLAQSTFDWKIISLSATDAGNVLFSHGLEAGAVTGSTLQLTNLPISSVGLAPGTVWNDSGTLKIA